MSYPTEHRVVNTRESKVIPTDLVVLVAIELKENNIEILLRHLLEFWCHHLARAAPVNKSVRQSSDSTIYSEVRPVLFLVFHPGKKLKRRRDW